MQFYMLSVLQRYMHDLFPGKGLKTPQSSAVLNLTVLLRICHDQRSPPGGECDFELMSHSLNKGLG